MQHGDVAVPLFSVLMLLGNDSSFMFDEPSSYLDVKQRLRAAQMIRSLIKSNNYIIVVEHDLSVLDYLSDFICCLYGVPGAYGVVTMPFSVREGWFLSAAVPFLQPHRVTVVVVSVLCCR